MKSGFKCQYYRMPCGKYKNLGVNIDLVWQRNAPFVKKISLENDMNCDGFCLTAKMKIQCLRKISRHGGWFFSEGCLPIREIEAIRPPDKITFAFSRNRNLVCAQIIGVPPQSESKVEDFISLVTLSRFRFLLQYEEFEEVAFDRAAVQYAMICDVAIVNKIFSGEDILINRWGQCCHHIDFSGNNFALMPVSRFQDYDETEPYLYYGMADVIVCNSLIGAVFRCANGLLPNLPSSGGAPAPHVGGHFCRTNMDTGAFDVMIDNCHAHSFIDVGCGTGGMVAYAKWKGLYSIGIDGDTSLPNHTFRVYYDFTIGDSEKLLTRDIDLLWTVEFLEHIEEKFLPNLLGVFKKARQIISTAATPGQLGYHHVNCRDAQYWCQWFAYHGFEMDLELTAKIRARSTMRSNFMRDNGLVWRRKDG